MDESCSLIVERDSTLLKVWVDFMNESLTMAVPSMRCDVIQMTLTSPHLVPTSATIVRSADLTSDSCHKGLPPKTSRPRCVYRAQAENSSDDYAVILPEVAVAFGDLDQTRMCHFPI
jgi:hypothetical protein